MKYIEKVVGKYQDYPLIVKTLDRGRKFKEERDVAETYYKQNMCFKRLQFSFHFFFCFETLLAVFSESFLYGIIL